MKDNNNFTLNWAIYFWISSGKCLDLPKHWRQSRRVTAALRHNLISIFFGLFLIHCFYNHFPDRAREFEQLHWRHQQIGNWAWGEDSTILRSSSFYYRDLHAMLEKINIWPESFFLNFSFHADNQEANATFRILLNESTRRLKVSAKKLGSSIEKSRPYHEALEKARIAQIECQRAAAKFQRANGEILIIQRFEQFNLMHFLAH